MCQVVSVREFLVFLVLLEVLRAGSGAALHRLELRKEFQLRIAREQSAREDLELELRETKAAAERLAERLAAVLPRRMFRRSSAVFGWYSTPMDRNSEFRWVVNCVVRSLST